MKAYLVPLNDAQTALDLTGALLEEGVQPEDISVVLDESFSERVTDVQPSGNGGIRLENELIGERLNDDLDFASSGNPEMERSYDQNILYESEIGGGISTASPNDAVSGVEEADDSEEMAEDMTYPMGDRDERTHGPDAFDELDPEAFDPTMPAEPPRASPTGIHGQDNGFGVGILASLIPAVIPGVGVVMGDGPLASDLMAEEAKAIQQGIRPFLISQGVDDADALKYEAAVAAGGAIIEVTAASGEASGRQVLDLLEQYAANRYQAITLM